jgi:hypothetical protein
MKLAGKQKRRCSPFGLNATCVKPSLTDDAAHEALVSQAETTA